MPPLSYHTKGTANHFVINNIVGEKDRVTVKNRERKTSRIKVGSLPSWYFFTKHSIITIMQEVIIHILQMKKHR